MNDPDSPDSSIDESSAETKRQVRIGVVLGIVSAVGYAATNLALRKVATPGDTDWAIWVTANKAVPAALVAWGLVLWRLKQGLPALPPRRLVGKLLLASVLMQYGGNFMFQWSLSLGGLVITVPLCFAAIIIAGAWLGRIVLNDPITPRTMASVVILGASILFLSIGAGDAATAMNADATPLTIVLAVVTACVSGASYGIIGVIIRRLVTSDLSVSSSLVVFSSFGVVVPGAHAVLACGVDRVLGTTGDQWVMLIAAGCLNAIAFFSVACSLKRINVNFVNVLNAGQNAMCAAAGVLLFAEPYTHSLATGCVLTVIGLSIVDSGHRSQAEQERDDSSASTDLETASC